MAMLATTAIAEPRYMSCGKDYRTSSQMGRPTLMRDGPTLSLGNGVVYAELTQAGGVIANIQRGGNLTSGGVKKCTDARYFAASGNGRLADGNTLSIGTEIEIGVSNPTKSPRLLCVGNGTLAFPSLLFCLVQLSVVCCFILCITDNNLISFCAIALSGNIRSDIHELHSYSTRIQSYIHDHLSGTPNVHLSNDQAR